MTSPYRLAHDQILLAVRLTPNGGRDAFDGVEVSADGLAHLKARVSAVPEKGKANKALIAYLADRCGVPKSAVSIELGASGRTKRVEVAGVSDEELERLLLAPA